MYDAPIFWPAFCIWCYMCFENEADTSKCMHFLCNLKVMFFSLYIIKQEFMQHVCSRHVLIRTIARHSWHRNNVVLTMSCASWDTKNTMLVSFDIKFIRREQKQRRNVEACPAVIEYKYLSWVYGVDRKICHEGHWSASGGLPSDAEQWFRVTDFSIHTIYPC